MTTIQENPQLIILKKHVQAYGRPDDKRAYMALALTLLYEAIAIFLIMMDFTIIGWTLHSLNQVRSFIQFHDMAHFSFFSSIKTNILFGKIIGVITHFPFNAWRDGHNHHHKHFGNLDRMDLSQTILFTKKQYEQMKGVKKILIRIFREPLIFFLITAPFIWFIGLIVTVAKRYGILSWTFFEKCLSVFLFCWVFSAIGLPGFYICLALYFSNLIGTILFHLQHSVNTPYRQRQKNWNSVRAALQGSTLLEVPYLLKQFTAGIEYHHIHHLNTNVPSYAIGQCHYEFDDSEKKEGKKWEKFGINQVGMALALKSIFNVMLDEQKGELIPFDYKWW